MNTLLCSLPISTEFHARLTDTFSHFFLAAELSSFGPSHIDYAYADIYRFGRFSPGRLSLPPLSFRWHFHFEAEDIFNIVIIFAVIEVFFFS